MKILVTGGTGILGKGFEEVKKSNHEIINLHQRDYQISTPNSHHIRCDVLDYNALDKIFLQNCFDIVIHSAGIANVDYVESNYDESYKANILGTKNIITLSNKYNAYLIYISTNAVFNGQQAPYKEGDRPDPVNSYGKIKLECEELVRANSQSSVIVRPILLYGWNYTFGRSNPVTWALDKLKNGEIIQVVNDIYENPLYNIQCAEALWKIAEIKPSGIFHLAGGESLSRFNFLQKVADEYSFDKTLIQPVSSSYFKTIAKRPTDTTFMTVRMNDELGIKPMEVAESLNDMKIKAKSAKNSHITLY